MSGHRNNFLLDADETVLDFVRSSRESLRFAMAALGVPYSDVQYPLYKRINDDVWAEYERGELTKGQLHVLRFSRFFGLLGVDADAKRAHELYFGKLCKTGYLLPGAEPFLRTLCGMGHVFLITNGTPQAQYGRLDALGIRGLFNGIFVSDEIGFAKPDPRFFSYVLTEVGAAAQDCVVIGDSLTSDIAGANGAGIASVWYAPSGGQPHGAQPDKIARSYADILRFLSE